MANNAYIALAVLPIVAYLVYIQVYNWRFKKYKHIPQLPNSLFIGHLPQIASGFKKFGDTRRHIGTMSTIKKHIF